MKNNVDNKEKKKNSFLQYFSLVFKDFFRSFVLNKEKLAAWLISIPAIIIGFSITLYYDSCVSYSATNYNGFFVFAFFVLACINVFLAFSLSKKKNLGTCVLITLVTSLLIFVGIMYILSFEKVSHMQDGVEVVDYLLADNPKTIKSIVVTCICMGLSFVGLILGYIYRDRFYKKDIY